MDATSLPTPRRSARAILIDERGRLVLIRRQRPGRSAYWTTPGGGVEPADATLEATVHRELAEELGATAVCAGQVLRLGDGGAHGVQHFFLAALTGIDATLRTGEEYTDPGLGTYDVDRIDPSSREFESIDLKPEALKSFVLEHRESLVARAAAARV
ncbi:NUDIX domain-containing protein [Agromyces allii]|nr:NUDIX domain-containing protein [Agromyces allii]